VEKFQGNSFLEYRTYCSTQNSGGGGGNPDPEYYNREVKRLKVKVRGACNRKIWRAFPSGSVLNNEGKCWAGFYKYLKRRKGNRENIPAVKVCNSILVTD